MSGKHDRALVLLNYYRLLWVWSFSIHFGGPYIRDTVDLSAYAYLTGSRGSDIKFGVSLICFVVWQHCNEYLLTPMTTYSLPTIFPGRWTWYEKKDKCIHCQFPFNTSGEKWKSISRAYNYNLVIWHQPHYFAGYRLKGLWTSCTQNKRQTSPIILIIDSDIQTPKYPQINLYKDVS